MNGREIKFRAWGVDGRVGPQMWGWEHIRYCFDLWLDGEDFHVMQFTGLLDRAGREVYEGDIVALATRHHIYGIVEWGRDGWCLRWDRLTAAARDEELSDGLPANLDTAQEVIGNIYEHPHLLGGDSHE